MDPDGDYDGRQYTPDNAPTVLVAAPLPDDGAAPPWEDDSDDDDDTNDDDEYYVPPEPTLARPYRPTAAPRNNNNEPTLARPYYRDDNNTTGRGGSSSKYLGDLVAHPLPSKTEKRPKPVVVPPPRTVKSFVPQQQQQHAQQQAPPASPPHTTGRSTAPAPAPPRSTAPPQPTAAARPGMKKIPIETIKETIDENGNKTIYKTIRYEYVPIVVDQPPVPPQPAPAMERGRGPQQPQQEPAKQPPVVAPQQRQPNNNDDDALAILIPRALNNNYNHRYNITAATPGVLYQIQDGDLCMNIWCGCFAQYYAFDIHLRADRTDVLVTSTVPCGGFWGGAIGVSKNNAEKRRVQQVLQSQVFADRHVILQ